MTGVKPIQWDQFWFKGYTIHCLDRQQRLLYSFAVITEGEYKTFRTLRAAKGYINKLPSAVGVK